MLQLKNHQTNHFTHLSGFGQLQLGAVVSDDDELLQEIDQQRSLHDDNWTLDPTPDVEEVEQFWTNVQADIEQDPDWYTLSDDQFATIVGMNKLNITKAIIPVAGWGTRMLPITKAIEKSMLPVGTRPVIDYVVQDVIKAGIKDLYFVVGEQSSQIQSYYRSNIPLNDYLKRAGKEDKLPLIAPLSGVNIHFITQPSTGAYGTSVPVGLCSEYIDDDESAIVIMGDQFFWRQDGGSNAADLIDLVRKSGVTSGLFGNPVPEEEIPKYGIIEKDDQDLFVRIVEKPSIEAAPSNLNNSSFYIFDKKIFDLAKTLPANPERGEYEITDAINAYVSSGQKIIVGAIRGEYMECGSVDGWLRANNTVAS